MRRTIENLLLQGCEIAKRLVRLGFHMQRLHGGNDVADIGRERRLGLGPRLLKKRVHLRGGLLGQGERLKRQLMLDPLHHGAPVLSQGRIAHHDAAIRGMGFKRLQAVPRPEQPRLIRAETVPMSQRLRHFARIPMNDQLGRRIAGAHDRLPPGQRKKGAARILERDQVMAGAEGVTDRVSRGFDSAARKRARQRLFRQIRRIPGGPGLGQPGVVQSDDGRRLPIPRLVIGVRLDQIVGQIRAQQIENARKGGGSGAMHAQNHDCSRRLVRHVSRQA